MPPRSGSNCVKWAVSIRCRSAASSRLPDRTDRLPPLDRRCAGRMSGSASMLLARSTAPVGVRACACSAPGPGWSGHWCPTRLAQICISYAVPSSYSGYPHYPQVPPSGLPPPSCCGTPVFSRPRSRFLAPHQSASALWVEKMSAGKDKKDHASSPCARR
jgi:hypothetical protein